MTRDARDARDLPDDRDDRGEAGEAPVEGFGTCEPSVGTLPVSLLPRKVIVTSNQPYSRRELHKPWTPRKPHRQIELRQGPT